MRQKQSAAFYQKAIDRMQFSAVKLEAVLAYNEKWNGAVDHTVPLLEYHDRWEEVGDLDYEKSGLEPFAATRGYNISRSLYLDSKERYQDLSVHHSWYSSEEAPAVLTEESLEYFDRMVSFCRDKELQLILVSPLRPASWDAGLHNAMEALSREYEIPYYDLNASPLLEQLDFMMGVDHQDNHLNYYGARKVTAWYGDYLKANHLNHDISEEEKYVYMKDQLERYRSSVRHDIEVRDLDDVGDYLQAVTSLDHCYVLISVKDEASSSLTEGQRAEFDNLGLKGLADIGFGESYIGVIADGGVVTELCDKMLQETSFPEGCLHYRMDDWITVKSGGANRGNLSSIMVNGTEYSKNQRGINVVVYDYEEDKVYDSAAFDTYLSAYRVGNVEDELQKALREEVPWYEMEGKVKKLFLFNRRFRNAQKNDWWSIYGDENSLFAFLNLYRDTPGYAIILSVKDMSIEGKSQTVILYALVSQSVIA